MCKIGFVRKAARAVRNGISDLFHTNPQRKVDSGLTFAGQLTGDAVELSKTCDDIFSLPNYKEIIAKESWRFGPDAKKLILKLKDSGIKIKQADIDNLLAYHQPLLESLSKDTLKLCKTFGVSDFNVLTERGLIFHHLSEKDVKYLNKNKDLVMKFLEEDKDLLKYVEFAGDGVATKHYNLAARRVLNRVKTNPMGDNAILNLGKTPAQKKELNTIMDDLVERLRAYQDNITACDFGVDALNHSGINNLTKELNSYLQSNKLVANGTKVQLAQLRGSADCGEGIVFSIKFVGENGQDAMKPLCLKVFKTKGANINMLRGVSDKNMVKSHSVGSMKELKISKYIHENTQIPKEQLECGEVFGGNSSSAYTLAEYVQPNPNQTQVLANDFERLGIRHFDDEVKNRVAGKLIDFGGFDVDTNNPIWQKWIKENRHLYE